MMLFMRLVIAVLLAAAGLSVATPGAALAAKPLTLGFYDPVYRTAPATSAPWLQRTVEAGADIVKIDAGWPAATRPVSPRDPADRAYDFRATDGAVRAAHARGLQILLIFAGAPAWAEGARRPAGVAKGSWKPNPVAIGDYGAALARRYSGDYPDPLGTAGTTLPRVKAFQLWNEPNLAAYLTPQWSGRKPAAPDRYRKMLNAFYAGVKSVTRKALVVTAGTAPFGDHGRVARNRVAPARFWRGLLCQTQVGTRLKPTRCKHPAHFDVLAHHPYPSGPPHWRENYADDVSINGMPRLTRILRAAERSGRALGRKRHRVWVTEVSYDSSPPDPAGVPLALHARYLEETLYVLWRAGVDTITWFRIVDELPVPSYGDTNQSGLYRLDGRAKPAARAFRFPFVVERVATRGRAIQAWGRSPIAGRVTIERRRGTRWIALRRVTVKRHATFLVRLPARVAPGSLRARVGSETSLAWRAS